MRTVVFVVAHADDLELGAGGTCALLVSKGYDVRVVVAADDPDAERACVRRREAVAGALALGVPSPNVHFLGLGMGHVVCDRTTVTALRSLIAQLRIKPLAVFTHSSADSHQDHVEVSRLARATFRQTVLFKFLVRNSAIVSAFAPSIHCIIDDHLDAKEQALDAHVSQIQAGRIQHEQVRAFTARYAERRSGRHCEAFEMEIQNDAMDISQLIATIDRSPFAQFWSAAIANARLTVLVGSAEAVRDPDAISDVAYLTRLQSRLLSTVQTRLGDPPAERFMVHHARGIGDLRHAERSNVLVLGAFKDNPTAAALQTWLGLPHQATHASATRRRATAGRGLLTIAANPFAARNGLRRFLFGATGEDQAASLAAAMCLLDDAKIARLLPEALAVIEGRLAIVEIEVASDAPPPRVVRLRQRQRSQPGAVA